MSGFISLDRPEAGGIRCQHLIAEDNLTVVIQTEFKLGIRDDDTAGPRVIRALRIQGDRCFFNAGSVFPAVPRELLLQNVNGALVGDVFIMVADFRFRGRSVDRFGKLIAFLQPFRKTDAADGSVLLIALPA